MQSIIFEYVERGQVDEQEFNDWYDTEHIRGLLSLPGIVSAQRYIATDGVKPTNLTLYYVNSTDVPAIVRSPSFKQQFVPSASERRTRILAGLESLNIRVYKPTFEYPAQSERKNAKYLFVHTEELNDPSIENEFAYWCNVINLPNLAKIEGWLGTRRFKIQESLVLEGNAIIPSFAPTLLGIHGCSNDNYWNDPHMVTAVACPWTRLYVVQLQLIKRHFVFLKDFDGREIN
ncbi:hypothetical protein BJ165DRAFT_1406759 [Panaeolus papilionaceus]|nr:hypothetical protein BJ165DRAFT_1406759 [Panaeolus papilionaceus]